MPPKASPRPTRPDPASVTRRPMARAPSTGRIAVAPTGPSGASSPSIFDEADRLVPEVLERLLDEARAVTEGRLYPPPEELAPDTEGSGETICMGSTLLTLGALPGEASEKMAGRLARVIQHDPRARRLIADRARREVRRLMGEAAPDDLDLVHTARAHGAAVWIDVDFEGRLRPDDGDL